MSEKQTAQDAGWLIPVFAGVMLILIVMSYEVTSTPRNQSSYDIRGFSQLPVAYLGRVKPLDSVARDTLTSISGRTRVDLSGEKISAAQWILDVMARPAVANEYEVFRIDNQDVKAILHLDDGSQKRFSFNAITANLEELMKQAQMANDVPKKNRSVYQTKLLDLWANLNIYASLRSLQPIYAVPPASEDAQWMSMLAAAQQSKGFETLQAFEIMLESYQAGKPVDFNRALRGYEIYLQDVQPKATWKAYYETFYNWFSPFFQSMYLYVVAGILIFASWLVIPHTLIRTAMVVLIGAALIHTFGLVSRIYISGRPPVTNLYSSALFIGWAAVLCCIVMEYFFRNTLNALTAAIIGVLTLLVAYELNEGDTMGVLQAVLDTNFWLATHVVVITLGYSAMFIAGLFGILYVITGLFTTKLDKPMNRNLGQMIYGIICFAVLASFIGTILGGIWADQSWGRFWGWDPKENGAALIVLWSALILHARWGGMVRQRGMAILAIFGNIVTAWSWFGTNMLGTGLHDYGFTDDGKRTALIAFVLINVIFIVMGSLPERFWVSVAANNMDNNAPDKNIESKSNNSKQSTGKLKPA